MAYTEPSRGLLLYLEEIACSRSYSGVEDRAMQSRVRSRRTVYRWRQQLAGSLRVMPSFALQALGLVHLHLVVHRPTAGWTRFPYAVEHAWLTSDFLEDALYLHCLVPAVHEAPLRELLADLQRQGWCRSTTIIISNGPRQELRLTGESARATLQPAVATDDAVVVLHSYPLVVPVICESWRGQESFAGVWARIVAAAGEKLRTFVPRGRLYPTNGKAHVKAALDALEHAGLFEQHIIRFEALLGTHLEVFLIVRRCKDWLPELLDALRPVTRVVESYGDEQGASVVRAVGARDLLDFLLAAQAELQRHGVNVFVRNTHHHDPASVRFCYEFLFNARTGLWEFPREQILNHLGVSR